MINLKHNDLHPNSIISELTYDNTSKTTSITPERIFIDSKIELIPIFNANFTDVSKLFRQTNKEVFKHYGTTKHKLPSDTKNYVEMKEKLWNDADWFEYIIKYNNSFIGKTYLNAGGRLDSFERGIWLQKEYWGNKISQKIADALIYITFEELDASYFTVGCVIQNVKSRKSIEKYIHRYNGSFYGFVPRTDVIYHEDNEDIKSVVKHPEWIITHTDYYSNNTGISTTIPNMDYKDIDFDGNNYI